jgi:hypothetical protein
MHDASAELRTAHERLLLTQQGFNEAEKQHAAKLAAATAGQEGALAQERKKLDEERLQQENALAAREKRVSAAERKLAAAVEANEALKADLDRRLSLLRSLSAA